MFITYTKYKFIKIKNCSNCGRLKKTVVGYIYLEQKETYKKLKIEVDIVSDTGILIMLLLVMITKMILLCWYCYCYC